MSNIKNFIEKTAKGAGKILIKHFGKLKHVEAKGRRDVVTEVDTLSENFIINKIKDEFPEDSILGEETGMHKKGKRIWIIDPLDGTKNYAVRNPFFSVSIGLMENREIKYAGVYAPIVDEFYYAEKNKGATLNGRKITVSNKELLKDSFVCFCRGLLPRFIKRSCLIYSKLAPKVLSLRQVGAASLELCYVAAGRVEAFYSNDTHPWDIAAGQLIVRESGGIVSDFNGKEINLTKKYIDIIAASPKIHKKILKEIKRAIS